MDFPTQLMMHELDELEEMKDIVDPLEVTAEDISRWDAEDKMNEKNIHENDNVDAKDKMNENIENIHEDDNVRKEESDVIDKTVIDLIDFSKMLQTSCSPTSRKRKFNTTLNKSYCNRVRLC